MESGEKNILSLKELLGEVRETLESGFREQVWVRAEISELKNHPTGHCYLTLTESEPGGGLAARAQAIIWASRYRLLKPYFESETGQSLAVGMTVLVRAQVQYSELYSLSLLVSDIDPSFTVGEQERIRRATIARLEKEGMMDMNPSLTLTRLPRSFAVISAETAAGYRDFMRHMHENEYGFRYHTELFPALMQGSEAPQSIIAAMDSVAQRMDEFDALLILRGGGGAMDLVCFDDYELAVNVAQFPLPVLTGIGHDHDYHAVDMVAYANVKTPTALADYLVDIFAREDFNLESLSTRLRLAVRGKAASQLGRFDSLLLRIRNAAGARFSESLAALDRMELRVSAANPATMLSRGWAMALKEGRKITSVTDIKEGDDIVLLLGEGRAEARITKVKK